MTSFAVSREFEVPAEVAFDVFTNGGRYPEYTPIRRVEVERAGEGGGDGSGAVRALHGGPRPLRERVLESRPPERFEFEVLSGAPVRAYRGVLRFEPADCGCRVTYEVDLEPLVPGTGWAVAAGFRSAIEVLMRLAGPEARRRAAGSASPSLR